LPLFAGYMMMRVSAFMSSSTRDADAKRLPIDMPDFRCRAQHAELMRFTPCVSRLMPASADTLMILRFAPMSIFYDVEMPMPLVAFSMPDDA